MPRFELERREEDFDEDRDAAGHESFDRLAFAERALALVRPRGTTVALCIGDRRLRVEHGRQWGADAGARWAIVSVPPTASRRAIVHAILTLVADDPRRLLEQPSASSPYRAWTLDVLLGACD